MARNDYDYNCDDDLEIDPLDANGGDEELELDEDDELGIGPRVGPGGKGDVEISMEVDADGREVWYAEDPRIPGSSSIGHSAEEAVEGVEDRRQQYRDILQRSRDESMADEELDEIPEPEHTGEHEVKISMEVDESGREIWYAKDPRVPGSQSIGHSAEEAVDGLEERRKKFREMLKKSREQGKDK